jgi:predicted amidohydrolase YtcJ
MAQADLVITGTVLTVGDARPTAEARAVADGRIVAAVRREIVAPGAAGAHLNGWDPLLQDGLPAPELVWLDKIAPEGPLVIPHNSGRKAHFNSRAALTRDTPDPKGANCATWLAGRRVHGR